MTSTIKLLILGIICFSFQSCSGEGEESTTDNETEATTDSETTSDNSTTDEATETETSEQEPQDDYHITLNKGGEEITTGPSAGKALISDAFICTVGDWKMRILTDEFDPQKMVGNEYHAHIISKEYNSMNCKCQMKNLTGTGITNSVGERVKMEGDITCDDGEATGSFTVQLIQQKQ